MRPVISGITELISMLLIVFGIVIGMCDTADLDKQFTTMLIGVAIIAIGTVFGFISKEVGNVHPR